MAKSCSQGNKLAEEQLYRTYAGRVYALCRRYLGDEEEAKDLMLETFLQALDKIDTFKYSGEGSLYAWISRIAINKAINQIKRHRWRFVPLDRQTQDDIPEPTEEEMLGVPHHMIGCVPPFESYSVSRYVEDGSRIADELIPLRGNTMCVLSG